MAIPTFKSLTYETELADGTIVKYRPYVVREERQLLIALEAGDEKVVGRAIQDIIDACTFGKLNIGKLPVYDIEHIFIKMRSKAVGAKIKLSSNCSKCEEPNEQEIDLDQVNTAKLDPANNPRIMITEDMGMLLRPPSYDIVMSTHKESRVEALYETVISCVDKIFDGDEIFECNKEPREEVVAFVESLSYEYFNKIKDYIEALPSVSYDMVFECNKCNEHNNIKLSGLANFFT
jgi:hypothetical protein|tara:strand:+ start:1037 stop:1738 length:702 start_codon:yes stop_codon:yes gene_type:complete